MELLTRSSPARGIWSLVGVRHSASRWRRKDKEKERRGREGEGEREREREGGREGGR
jgi:hypothetical protein